MDTLRFLSLVTPDAGDKVVAVLRGSNDEGKPRWFHTAFTSHADAVTTIQNTAYETIYYALGGFASGTVFEWRGRLQANVTCLRALWLDIDVDPNNAKKYPTKAAAGQALGAFITHYNLPEPLIVISGGGLHIYWPLDADLPRAEWKPVATALKAACTEFGLLADPSRTSDEASVLRPVGTINRKHGLERLVRPLEWGGAPYSIDILRGALGVIRSEVPALSMVLAGVTPASAAMMAVNNAAAVHTEVKKNAKLVFAKCKQMGFALAHMRFSAGGVDPVAGDRGEPVSEPLWRAGVSVLLRCVNGQKHAHTFSSSYPEYTFVSTQAKIARIGDMPSTCATFEAYRPGGCNGCPHYGKVKSPIILGSMYEDIGAPELAMQATVLMPKAISEHGFEVKEITDTLVGLPPPYPYKRTAQGLVKSRSIPVLDPDTGNKIPNKFVVEDWLFCHYDIHPVFIAEAKLSDMDNSQFMGMWRVIPKKDVKLARMFLMPQGDLSSDDRIKTTLYSASAYSLDGEPHKEVCKFMRHYMAQIEQSHIQKQPNHFGWQQTEDLINGHGDIPPNGAVAGMQSNWDQQEMEFVTGNQRIYRKPDAHGEWSVALGTVSPSADMSATADCMKPRGTLEGWALGAAFYKDHYSAEHIAAFLLATASPFARFSKNHGMVVVARGEKGTGKTQVQNLAASVWGNPAEYIVGGTNTANAPEAIAAKMHSLPIIMDDKVGGTRESIMAEVMLMANNSGKSRMKYVGGTPSSAPTARWCTNVLASTNASWLDIISGKAHDPSNEGVHGRLLEITIPRVPSTAWPTAGTAGEHMFNNYIRANCGLVGPLLIQDYLASPSKNNARILQYEAMILQEIKDRADSGNAVWKKFANSESEFRLQLGTGACALLVLYFLRRRKLVDWSPSAFITVLIDAIAKILGATTESRPDKADLLAMYINEFQGNFVMVTAVGAQIGVEENNFGKLPVGRIVGRIDQMSNTTWLDRGAFKEWLAKKGVPEAMVLKGLANEGWSVSHLPTDRMVLGKGFPTISKVQTRCIVLHREVVVEKV